MLWTAHTRDSYRSGAYLVAFEIRHWSCWLIGSKRLGEAPTMREAMKIAENLQRERP